MLWYVVKLSGMVWYVLQCVTHGAIGGWCPQVGRSSSAESIHRSTPECSPEYQPGCDLKIKINASTTPDCAPQG